MATRTARGNRNEALAADVWRVLATFGLSQIQRGPHLAILRRLGLTPGDLKVLAVLDPEEPEKMRALADALSVDPSMATWFVDRLEEKGLVERRTVPSDRRVKRVVLTPRGLRIRQQLLAALFEPPPELLQLDRERLEALRRALEPLPLPASPFDLQRRAG